MLKPRSARLAPVKQADEMSKNGLVTPSDALLASVKAGEVEHSSRRRGDVLNARLGLATLLGTPGDSAWQLPAGLPASDALRALAREALDASPRDARADVDAARAGADAAGADARRARALYLPRLNGFARYDWNSALRPFGGDNNWTVGVMASWTPFAGASELGDVRAGQPPRRPRRCATVPRRRPAWKCSRAPRPFARRSRDSRSPSAR
jgi:outer membrane protein TolC